MTKFRVINRVSRKEQLLNSSEVSRFFKLNDIREYAISKVKSNLDSLEIFYKEKALIKDSLTKKKKNLNSKLSLKLIDRNEKISKKITPNEIE